MKKNIFKKEITIGVTILFISLIFTSSINANVSYKGEKVIVTTQFSGFGKKHTIQLTQQIVEELEQLFDNIKTRLDRVTSKEETIKIFNEVIVELDKYELLDGLNVKLAQKMVTCSFLNSRFLRL